MKKKGFFHRSVTSFVRKMDKKKKKIENAYLFIYVYMDANPCFLQT